MSQRSRAALTRVSSGRCLRASTGDVAGPPGRLDGRGQGHRDPDHDRQHDGGRRRSRHRDGQRPDGRGLAAQTSAEPERQGLAEANPEYRPEETQGQGLEEDEPVDLVAGGAGRPQERHLADSLGDRHRQRVEDQEGAHEQRDRGDQGGRGLEVGGRGAQRGGHVRRSRDDVGLGVDPLLDAAGDDLGDRACVEEQVDPADATEPEQGGGPIDRDDNDAVVPGRQRTRAGQDPRPPSALTWRGRRAPGP